MSPSTAEYDRQDKFHHYQQLPSLQHVVFVAYDTRQIEVWSRDSTGDMGCELEVDAIYNDPLNA